MKIALWRLAHARSGDKGDVSNIGLIAKEARHYPALVREVTVDRVQVHFRGLVESKVARYELPNLHAMNFVMEQALDGGGTISLRTDAQGKTHGAALLMMVVEVSADELGD